MGLPVLRRNPLYACRRHYPGGTVGCSRCLLPQRRRPSPKFRRVGSRITFFEACSAFTARYGLHTRRVALRPSTPEASEMSLPASPLRLLPTAATFVGWDSHPLKFRAFSRRTELFRLRSRLKIPSGLHAAAKAPVGVGQTHPRVARGAQPRYISIWAGFPALTATFSLVLGNSPVILKRLLRLG